MISTWQTELLQTNTEHLFLPEFYVSPYSEKEAYTDGMYRPFTHIVLLLTLSILCIQAAPGSTRSDTGLLVTKDGVSPAEVIHHIERDSVIEWRDAKGGSVAEIHPSTWDAAHNSILRKRCLGPSCRSATEDTSNSTSLETRAGDFFQCANRGSWAYDASLTAILVTSCQVVVEGRAPLWNKVWRSEPVS